MASLVAQNLSTHIPAPLTTNAEVILKKRYLHNGESIDNLWHRVADGNEKYIKLLSSLRFLPNSPTLFNAGLNNGCTLAACFVFSLMDSMFGKSSITDVRSKAIAVAKAGGGVGYYFGHLRPKGSPIKTIQRVACGPVTVLKDYHYISHLITQGGKRELAQMGILNCDHQDIHEFIHCKDADPQGLGSFNISVSWPDKWIKSAHEPSRQNMTQSYQLWQEQCRAAWAHGCPGMFFYDTVNKANPNKHLGMIEAPNPCLVGSTLVMVADGRGSVSIQQLAEEGVDVPVYCQNQQGKVAVRMMRNPRLTRSCVPIYKVSLDNGKSIKVTGNHKFLLKTKLNGKNQYVSAKSLKSGDRLSVLTHYTPETCNPDSQSRGDRYSFMTFRGPLFYDHELIADFHHGASFSERQHVHHVNGNRLDNCPENLQYKSATEHLSDHSIGLENGNSKQFTNDELVEYGRNLTRSLGRRFSRKEWGELAYEVGLPTRFSEFRCHSLGSIVTFAKRCAELEGFGDHANSNPKLVRTYQKAINAGLDAEIVGNQVLVRKVCEACESEFTLDYRQREQACCSHSCANTLRDRSKATASLKLTNQRKQETIREQQVEVYLAEKQRLGRGPMKKEWVLACKKIGVSCEISRKSSPFTNYDALREVASETNHCVVSVKHIGWADVYNGTVDEFHNFFVGAFDEGVNKHGRRKTVYLCNLNCGETPNRSDEPCNLGSLSLPRYFTKYNRGIDWSLLEEDIYTASEFLDDILDRNTFPHPDITEAALLTRKLGLGVMGWADLLAMMHIHYDTEEALQLGEKIMKLFHDVSHRCSEDLVKKKGPYKGYSNTKTEAPMRRNETSTSIAPTGTIAILAGVWGSIEPHFALRCERTTNEGIKLQDGISDWVYEQLDGFTPKIASEVSPEWHVRHQAAFQKYTDLGCSKTVNLPNSATVEDVSRTYKLMHELGCKGGTIYRDGCRQEQVLVKQEQSKQKTKSVYLVNQSPATNGYHDKVEKQPIPVQMQQYLSDAAIPTAQLQPTPTIPKRRHLGDCVTKRHRFRVGGCNIYLHVGLFDDGSPGEIFLRASKWGSTIAGMIDSWAIAVSRLLQYGVPVAEIAKDNRGNRFEPNGLTNNPQLPTCTSIPDYVVRWLELHYSEKPNPDPDSLTSTDTQPVPKSVSVSREDIIAQTEKSITSVSVKSETLYGSGCYCPDCGGELIYQANCLCCVTQGCGYSKCGG